MILILAGAGDMTAGGLAGAWAASGARVVRPADLSSSGWRHYVGGAGGPGAVAVGGEVIPEAEVTGVLTRLAWVDPAELVTIVPGDRDYVASEVSAFLLSWLTSLDRPVVNRPMPGSLSGPPWRASQWVAAARVAGLRVESPGSSSRAAPATRVTVVGGECLGDASAPLRAGCLRLAGLARSDLLDLIFDGDGPDAGFLAASPFPPLDGEAVRSAVLALLLGPVRPSEGFPDLRPWRRDRAASPMAG